MSVEIKFMRRTVKYTWQDYRISEDILSELKMNSVLKKIQNYRNKWVHVQQMDKPCLIMKYQSCGKRNRLLKRLFDY